MTGMLASVTSTVEAEVVLSEGVDIVDLKNPQLGALGALDTNIVAEVVNTINGVVPSSATIGDIDPDDPELLETIYKMASTGVDIVKVGLFDSKPTTHFIDVISKAACRKINLVIVMFAENYTGKESFEALLQTGIKGIMLDTKDKNKKSLGDVLSYEVLKEFVTTVRNHDLLSGLAGSLRYEDINSLLKLDPDYLGFRGALCSGNNRVNQINLFKIKNIRNAIPHTRIINYAHGDDKEEVLKNGAVA
jgi:(5-formylfuran-3-yl)methyl phosphate synthase